MAMEMKDGKNMTSPLWLSDAHEMYELLGVKRLPDEGMEERMILGVRVYVKPLVRVAGRRRNFNGLRVMAICKCGQHVAVGRLHQHRCWKPRRAAMGSARWQVQYTWTETGPNGYEKAEYCLLHLVLDGKTIDRRIDYRYAERGQREWQTL